MKILTTSLLVIAGLCGLPWLGASRGAQADYDKSGVDVAPAFTELLTRLDARALPPERYAEDPTRSCRDFLRGWLDSHEK